MEFRKVFDTIPEQFDKYRPRYSAELFADLIEYAEIGPGKSVLELVQVQDKQQIRYLIRDAITMLLSLVRTYLK